MRAAAHATYVIAPPPRAVPTCTGLRVLFGGFLQQAGWFVFGFGMVFIWGMFPAGQYVWFWASLGGTQTARGRVVESRKTRAADDDTPIYVASYTYTTPDGTERRGNAYATGRQYNVGAGLTVEYAVNHPDISCAKYTRRSTFGLVTTLVAVFPIIGLSCLVPGFRKGRLAWRLLRNGQPTTGQLVSRTPTQARINDEPVYKLTFDYQAGDGVPRRLAVKTHTPEPLCDENHERILYDPADPDRAVLLDDLPCNLKLDPTGNVKPVPLADVFWILFLPTLTIVGHGAYLISTCLR